MMPGLAPSPRDDVVNLHRHRIVINVGEAHVTDRVATAIEDEKEETIVDIKQLRPQPASPCLPP